MLFVSLIAAAYLYDRFYNSGNELTGSTRTEKSSKTPDIEQIGFQAINLGAKPFVLKLTLRKFNEFRQDKYLVKFHELRDYQVMKVEKSDWKVPDFYLLHRLLLRQNNDSVAGDNPENA